MRAPKWLLIVIFAAAAILRVGDSLRPVDGASWREADMASIARNFAVEGMNPLAPRIDWRGTGPGYVEMEFPFTSWLTALCYKIFGIHDVIGRLWSLIFSIATLIVFLLLARDHLGPVASIAAFAFFAFNPLVLDASSSFKPESAMLLAYISAAYFFLKWYRTLVDRYLTAATLCTALALLTKATAAHLGIMFGVLLFRKYGLPAFTRSRIWLFGAISSLPAIAWYIYAKSLWLHYGNSLGVSNEYHWIGWDFLTNSYFSVGILKIEVVEVWLVFGLAVMIFGLVGSSSNIRNLSLLWLGSAFVMYIAAARTTADDWASYYHIFSVAPAALLFGVGVDRVRIEAKTWADTFSRHSMFSNFYRASVLILVFAATLGTYAIEVVRARSDLREHRVKDSDFQFAQSIRSQLRQDGPVLISGGPCFDDDGYPVAYNKSYMFYALGRTGSNICVEDQAIEKVGEYAAAGYSYFVAQHMETDKKPGFEAALEERYPITARNDGYTIFDLRTEKR